MTGGPRWPSRSYLWEVALDDIKPDWLTAARAIALALPMAAEKETWGHPTFRVNDKIFAGIGAGEVDGEPDFRADDLGIVTTMSMKAAAGEQEALLASGHPFFRPKYVGNRGWIGIIIDEHTDWSEIEELVIDSYREIAPKRLVIQLDSIED